MAEKQIISNIEPITIGLEMMRLTLQNDVAIWKLIRTVI